nr:SLAM family member 9-like [Misgurnus anguillicaudatus]
MDCYLLKKMSDVILFCLCLWSLVGVFGEFVSVTEGDSVTLSVNLTETQREDRISWKFTSQEINAAEIIIAETEDKGNTVTLHEDRAEGRFRDRLKLNKHTGSLTITNTNITHTGLYKVNTIRTNTQLKTINLTVYARLPVPVISRVSSQSSSSSSNCSLLCSVLNVRDVSLSWYRGKSLLSSISVSDLNNNSISLHLKCLDDSYSCVLNNPISNQTQHLNMDQMLNIEQLTSFVLISSVKKEIYCCCGFTEVVIRLVVSVLVGVAAVGFVVYDIRSRRDEEKRMRSDKLH